MKILISHIGQEAALALVLKEWVESTFGDACNVLVSSDTQDIPSDDEWRDRIDQALTDATALLVLCSPESISQPWIHFETGCGWIRQVPVIGLCLSGQTSDGLAPPLSRFEALELNDADSCRRLIQVLAQAAGRSRLPRISYEDMARELKDAKDAKDADQEVIPQPSEDKPKPKAAKPGAELKEKELRLLKSIAGQPRDNCTAEFFARLLDMPSTTIDEMLNNLLNKRKMLNMHAHFGADMPARYAVSPKGRAYLVKHKLI
ncbi:MAG: toll/interleukin-1 receptor domain-containing protein [Planctomycetes bacterium]|nr:toll/interleukin-1 receptor domain-containing protein [Planctomycetota bacterium]